MHQQRQRRLTWLFLISDVCWLSLVLLPATGVLASELFKAMPVVSVCQTENRFWGERDICLTSKPLNKKTHQTLWNCAYVPTMTANARTCEPDCTALQFVLRIYQFIKEYVSRKCIFIMGILTLEPLPQDQLQKLTAGGKMRVGVGNNHSI